MKSLLILVSLLALTAGRKKLCADLKLPLCLTLPLGVVYKPVYRPVWRNFGQGKTKDIDAGHGCYPGDGPPICADGSTAQFVFNVCKNDQKQCPHGHGQPGFWHAGPPGSGIPAFNNSKPFDACPGGAQPLCPSGKPNSCSFSHKRCPPYTKNSRLPRKQCNKGRPHCPWNTRNRNDEWNPHYPLKNQGPNRPQNKVNGNGILPVETDRPCAGACPCDNVHLFNATDVTWGPLTVTDWQGCGSLCNGQTDCHFWEWHKTGPHKDHCKLVSNYRKGVKQTNNDYKVVSGSNTCCDSPNTC